MYAGTWASASGRSCVPRASLRQRITVIQQCHCEGDATPRKTAVLHRFRRHITFRVHKKRKKVAAKMTSAKDLLCTSRSTFFCCRDSLLRLRNVHLNYDALSKGKEKKWKKNGSNNFGKNQKHLIFLTKTERTTCYFRNKHAGRMKFRARRNLRRS